MWAAGTGVPVEGLRSGSAPASRTTILPSARAIRPAALRPSHSVDWAGAGRRGAGESTWSVGSAPLGGGAVGVARTLTGWNVGAAGVSAGVSVAPAVGPTDGVVSRSEAVDDPAATAPVGEAVAVSPPPPRSPTKSAPPASTTSKAAAPQGTNRRPVDRMARLSGPGPEPRLRPPGRRVVFLRNSHAAGVMQLALGRRRPWIASHRRVPPSASVKAARGRAPRPATATAQAPGREWRSRGGNPARTTDAAPIGHPRLGGYARPSRLGGYARPSRLGGYVRPPRPRVYQTKPMPLPSVMALTI